MARRQGNPAINAQNRPDAVDERSAHASLPIGVSIISREDKKSDNDAAARYKARFGLQDRLIGVSNFLLACLFRQPQAAELVPPKRVLICNVGLLGDAIISTAFLPAVHAAYPGVEIGFLTSHRASPAIEGHPLLARVHKLDHWAVTAPLRMRASAILAYIRNFWAMAAELRAADYDMAIDLRSWFPNTIVLIWKAKIPVRVGFDRVGFAPLLTHAVHFQYSRQHVLEQQLELLRRIHISPEVLACARPNLPPIPEAAHAEAASLLNGAHPYRILHPASSTPVRDWNIADWRKLAESLLGRGITPVITGHGPRDTAMAAAIATDLPGIINACNRLSWAGLAAAVANADAVYSVETSVGHLASALGRPVIAIYGGMADPAHWAPRGAAIVSHAMPCSPCLDKAGCATRFCLTRVTAEDVTAAAQNVFGL